MYLCRICYNGFCARSQKDVTMSITTRCPHCDAVHIKYKELVIVVPGPNDEPYFIRPDGSREVLKPIHMLNHLTGKNLDDKI